MSLKYSELDYLNDTRIPPTYTCPTGYVLIDRFCELVPNMTCPPTYTIINGICTKTPIPMPPVMSPPVASPSPIPMPPVVSPVPPCPTGFERRGTSQTCYPIV